MFFKNIKLKYHVAVNWIASSTFGVLLIHANSDVMRQWLWEDTLHNAAAYQSNMIFVHAIVSVVVVFFVCILLDKLRIYLFEKPFSSCGINLQTNTARNLRISFCIN